MKIKGSKNYFTKFMKLLSVIFKINLKSMPPGEGFHRCLKYKLLYDRQNGLVLNYADDCRIYKR